MRRISRWTLGLAICAVASLVGAPGASAKPTRAKCPAPPKGVKEGRDVICAFVSVPRRHGVRGSVRYRVAVSVVSKQRPSSKRPLVILGGGPGESVAEIGPLIAGREGRRSLFGRLNQERDVILVDQRGAGSSKPSLDCAAEEKGLVPTADDAANVAAGVQAYSACAARLKSAGIDLAAFNTSQIAYDLRQIVGELDLGRVDVLAASHGTKVALLAASREDRWLGRMVLASAVAPGANFVTESAANFDRALGATFAACRRAPACAKRHPDPAGQLELVIANLQAEPLTVAAPGPAKTAVITAGLAATSLYGLFYQPEGFAQVPAAIAQLAARDPKLLQGGPGAPEDSATSGIAVGQFFSVECAEELAGLTPEALRQAAAPFGAAARQFTESQLQLGVGAPQICGAFGVPPSRARPADLRRIDRPTLVVNGAFDQITPPAYGVAVAKGIRGARLLTFGAGHSPVTQVGVCGFRVVSRFLDGRRVLGSCSG